MRHYQPQKGLEGLVPSGHITDLGAEVIGGGDLKTSVRVDWGSPEGPYCSGIWSCEKGTFRCPYPFTEMATLLEGEVIVTDGSGNVLHLKPGDSFMAEKGEMVIWEVREACIKSFMAIISSSD